MPLAATTFGFLGPAWLDMWSLALAIYVALKLFTWGRRDQGAPQPGARPLVSWRGREWTRERFCLGGAPSDQGLASGCWRS